MQRKWIKRPFRHSSLAFPQDPFRVHCWVKEQEEHNEKLPFEQFNFQLFLPNYTREEYQAFLHDEDWSFEETAYLLELCNRYELCFFAIADAYSFSLATAADAQSVDSLALPKRRTIEDIKERYFYVHGRIQRLKGPNLGSVGGGASTLMAQSSIAQESSNSSQQQQPQFIPFNYNKREEQERKKLLQNLYTRTEEQIIVRFLNLLFSFFPLGRDFSH